jgi:hypothetical protein
MVVNLRTGRQTFMKMLQVQGGLGFGVNQNRLIFVFSNEQALRNFINQGWEFGGQVNLSAMAGGQGGMFSGAAAVSPGIVNPTPQGAIGSSVARLDLTKPTQKRGGRAPPREGGCA